MTQGQEPPEPRTQLSERAAAIAGALGSRVEVPGTVTVARRQAAEDGKAIGNAENAPWPAWGMFEVVDQVTGLAVIP